MSSAGAMPMPVWVAAIAFRMRASPRCTSRPTLSSIRANADGLSEIPAFAVGGEGAGPTECATAASRTGPMDTGRLGSFVSPIDGPGGRVAWKVVNAARCLLESGSSWR
jgi:hypothetical protein